ncbi:neprilysin-4 [Scaptodrosophila lebanonensis]|uniref:Neprilysin-4 n=1 Tax=Drosophila lebanonensis TaxID=7225 RepID=A0A6J2U0X1_DROLE|nr:neprilysin-4 [Scaptodrosophila lebanonensis]
MYTSRIYAGLMPLLLLLSSTGRHLSRISVSGTPSSPTPGDCSAEKRYIEDQMDESSAACDDFYEHACGNWRAPYPLRVLGAHDTRTLMRALNKQLLIQHFDRERESQNVRQSNSSSAASFYNSCLSGRQVLRPYTEALRSYAEWPLLNGSTSSDSSSTFDWLRISAELRRYGVQGLWQLLVQPNWQASEQRVFYLMPPSFDLLRSRGGRGPVNEESVFLYERYIKLLLLDMGVRVRRANLIVSDLVSFERQLLSLIQPDSSQLVLRAPHTLQQLAALFPGLHLLDYFKTLLAGMESLPADYEQRLLIVADTAYLLKLEQLLSDGQAVSPQRLAKWLLIQFLAHFELHLHDDKLLAAQQEHCLLQLNTFMPREFSQLYVQLRHGVATGENFLAKAHTRLPQDFQALKEQFERMINATPIFENDAPTHKLALDKLRAMRLLLPQVATDTGTPAGLHLGDDYDENLLQLSRAQALLEFNDVLQCLRRGACGARESHTYGPLDVNGYYKLKRNVIELPIGVLRPPMYSECNGEARAFGSLGYVMAHELLHGFDYDGINYDEAGNAASQWTAHSIIKFGVRAACYLTPRYSNATLTIDENIADSEGLRLAFETFRAQRPSMTVEPSEHKEFFLAFAQTWCGHAAQSSGITQHASHRERVNNVLSNFPEFAETFQCKTGSLMHPADKCHIW